MRCSCHSASSTLCSVDCSPANCEVVSSAIWSTEIPRVCVTVSAASCVLDSAMNCIASSDEICVGLKPLMAELKMRLTEVLKDISSKSPLAEAIYYTLGHWDGLNMFLTDGRVEVDTNTVERSMRPIALGRKNSLFSGSEGGAESWAILASLLNTAKLNGLDPQTYLCDVLERIVSGRTKNHQLHELLAWNWKAAREAPNRAAA